MSSNTPRQLVTLFLKPLMPQELRIEIVDFKRAMVDMYRRLLLNEKRVMINKRFSPIEMEESRDIPPIRSIQYIGWFKGEVVTIKFVRLGEIGTIDSEMAEFVDGGGARFEAQKRTFTGFILSRREIADNLLGQIARFGGRLSVNEMEWEPIWVLDGDFVSSARSVDFFDFDTKLFGCGIEIFACFRFETAASKLGSVGLFADVDVLIGTVSAEEDSVIILLDNVHAKVEEELFDLGEVGMSVGLEVAISILGNDRETYHVRDFAQFDSILWRIPCII